MSHCFGGLATTIAVLLAGSALGVDDASFVSLFDGRSLEGWTPEHTDHYSVHDGVIVNSGGTGWLRYNKILKDFELQAEYRALKKGADSGVLFRATAESTSRAPRWPAKGYQLQVIDSKKNCAILGHGVAPPKFNRNANLLKDAMKGPKEWQTITLRVVGKHAEAALNGRTITVSDTIERPDGCIGLRSGNGHFEWRNLKVKELSAH